MYKLISITTVTLLLQCSSCTAGNDPVSIQAKKRSDKKAGKYQPLIVKVDSIVVLKNEREMHVFNNKKLLKTYIISLGSGKGKKHFEGDMKTPEGLYYINDRNANSIYHKNLGVSYPNNSDRQYARRNGARPGGDIKIHGLPNNPKYSVETYLKNDWTWGCVAVSNEEIDELFNFVREDCPILFLP